METHASGYTVVAALELARSLKHGPLPKPDDPTPTLQQAIEIIGEERRTCGFNWITGEVAGAVLRACLEGRKAGATNPYPDWSDEHQAWLEGNKNIDH